jgi:hypothetical protein
MEWRARLLSLIIDVLGMAACVIVCLILVVIPILNSINYPHILDPFFLEMNGRAPFHCTAAILIFGFAFDVATIGLVISARFFHSLEFTATFVVGWCTIIVGAGALAATATFLSYVNPDTCRSFERRIVYILYGNETSPNFRRWIRESRCVEPADCAAYAHSYVQETCTKFFTENMVLVCLGVAFFGIALVAIVIGKMRRVEEVEETESSESGSSEG